MIDIRLNLSSSGAIMFVQLCNNNLSKGIKNVERKEIKNIINNFMESFHFFFI